MKNQGFSARFSFHSSASWGRLIFPPDWPGAVIASSKPERLVAAEEALLGKLSPVHQSNESDCASFLQTCNLTDVQRMNRTWTAQCIQTASIIPPDFLQRRNILPLHDSRSQGGFCFLPQRQILK